MPANTPPTDDPLIERIGQHLIDTIAGPGGINVRQAAEGGFYFKGYTAGRPHPQTFLEYVDGRVQVVQGMTEFVADSSNTCSFDLRTYFTLRIDAAVPQRGTESLDRRLNLMAADVLKAVFADPSRGGIATWTDLAFIEVADEAADLTKARLDVVLTVQHLQSRNDPTAF